MTQLKKSTYAKKDHRLKVLMIPQGRKLYFNKECLEPVTIQRKVNEGKWEMISKNSRTPYIDDEPFDSPVVLAYKAVFEKQDRYEDIVEVHLN